MFRIYQELNQMMAVMNRARKVSDEINDRAFEARQKAIRLQYNANSAADMAALAAEMLAVSSDNILVSKLANASREAIRQAIESTEAAAIAVEEANKLDHEVTLAFRNSREAAVHLLEALDKLEASLKK
ncbi:hypothetical protein [Cohnella sp. GCM10012308]|uniref:hypothetical protein n=1 Tax=Cohnella sp. GCM10012308 TaxID=3317329 RepID=UPI0036231A4A